MYNEPVQWGAIAAVTYNSRTQTARLFAASSRAKKKSGCMSVSLARRLGIDACLHEDKVAVAIKLVVWAFSNGPVECYEPCCI